MSILSAIGPYVPVILCIAQAITTIIVLAFRSKFVPRDEFEKQKKEGDEYKTKHDQLEMKVLYMEKAMTQLPDAEAIHALSIQLTKFQGGLDTMSARFETINALSNRMQLQVDRMDEFLKRRPQ